MNLKIFAGDLTAAPVEAICTSTNPRLSLMMGTGGAVRERGGFQVLRECEAILQRAGRATVPVGSVHVTSAGDLPFKAVIHCVASDAQHKSSAEVIRACVTKSLAAARAAGCSSLAMPVFATGHARFAFEKALTTMLDALRTSATDLDVLVVVPPEREAEARKLIE